MPKRSSKKMKDGQQESTGQNASKSVGAYSSADPSHTSDGKNPAAVALGRLGGRKGGVARAKKLTAEQRREIAKKAALARWRKK